MCLFCKIVQKEIPATILYEDEQVIAFKDIAPTAPVHFLVIPKKHLETVNDLAKESSDIVSHIFRVIPVIAEQEGIASSGYRVVANCGSHGGQEVYHLHFHVMGGKQCQWPAV